MPSSMQSWMVATRRPADERVTIADVAREAGVNKGTVSRALRGVAGVGDSTRQRILATADRMEFSASHLATALATGTSHTVGIVLPTLRSWYFTEVAAGASEVLIPSSLRVELINLDIDSDYLDADSQQFRTLFRELGSARGRDALLFAGTNSDTSDEGADGATSEPTGHVPVSIGRLPITQVPGIFIDHRAGGALVAEHLLALGHRDFVIVDGRMPHKADASVWGQRSRGFLEALERAGIELDPADVIYPGDCHTGDGERAGGQLLQRATLPTAVFCHSDELAFGVLAELRRHRLSCPGDLSVAGFDGHPMSPLWDLTTVTQHARQQGGRAAWALLAALGLDAAGPDLEYALSDRRPLRVELVDGATTGPPRAAR